MSPAKLVLGSVALLTVAAATACQTRKFNANSKTRSETAVAPSQTRKACVGLQGNGVRFASHIGTLTALLESDVEPVVTMGGSSGSIVGSTTMALLQNTTYDSVVVERNGKALTRAQKAALLLGATPDILNAFIFLPSVNALWQTIWDGVILAVGMSYGKALLGDSEMRIVSTEAIVGQSVLMVDFFTNANFADIVALPTYEKRRAAMFNAWKEWSDGVSVNVAELIDSADGKGDAALADRIEKLDQRLFHIFQRDVAENDELIVRSWKRALDLLEDGLKSNLLKVAREKLEAIRFTVPDPKLVWNAYMGRSKEGGKLIPVPKGMIIHSTFRRGTFEVKTSKITVERKTYEQENGRLVEKIERLPQFESKVVFKEANGLENLLQGYVTDDHPERMLASELREVRQTRHLQGKGLQPFLAKKDIPYTLDYAYRAPNSIILRTVAKNEPDHNALKQPNTGQSLFKRGERGVAHGIMFSAGEPGPFARLMTEIQPEDRAFNRVGGEDLALDGIDGRVDSDTGRGIIAFGGWSENVPTSTLALLPSCADAHYFVSGAKPGLGNDFQQQAVMAAVAGDDAVLRKVRDFMTGASKEIAADAKGHFDKLNGNVDFSRNIIREDWRIKKDTAGNPYTEEARAMLLWNDLDFDAPSEAQLTQSFLTKEEIKPLNGKLTSDNFAMMIASYQKMKETMGEFDQGPKPSSQPPVKGDSTLVFGRDITTNDQRIALKTSVADIDAVLGSIK
jgi:hypothetical protein